EMFSQHLKNSPSRDLSDLEFTILIYLCLGVTNDGVGWLVGASRQSVERILGGLYRKLKIPSRRDAPQGVPTLIDSRTRLSAGPAPDSAARRSCGASSTPTSCGRRTRPCATWSRTVFRPGRAST